VSEPSDRELVAGLRAAEESAFDLAYERYRAPLFGFLVRLSGKRWLAEELLQETWLRLARNGRALPEDTELRPWLFTVARNLFVSQRRWAVLDAERLRALGLLPQRHPESPFEQVAANETEARLERALASLSLEQREVILLVSVEGLAPREAATVIGILPDALRQRLSRARAMLAERLAERKPR
jgi:RNA polymerase sigma-70 factor, ECF subfamily